MIQQRYDPVTKHTWWGEIDKELRDPIYLHEDFEKIFEAYARKQSNGTYPVLTLRQIMWALRMKPLPKQPWETVFDKKPV